MSGISEAAWTAQQTRNSDLIAQSAYMRHSVTSQVLPLTLDINASELTAEQITALQAVETQAARIAIKSLASLAKIGELDHLGGGLDLIPALTMTLALTDYEKVEYTIENAHCSIGYYGVLAALGFISEEDVIEKFRRSIDIPGHVSWVPGGTQLQGGRLGVMIPAAVGQALGKKAIHGDGSWVVCHTGDAGWISGQALNGFNAADLHGAPTTFIMHRNGLQLSSACKHIMDKDPRPAIAGMGITILEIPTLLDHSQLFAAYREAHALAQEGKPTLIYPVGYGESVSGRVDLNDLGRMYGITAEVEAFAAKNGVAMDTSIWIPGSLMSYRDVIPMIECIFLCNDLPGGKDHHDGSMKGREEAVVLGNPMMTLSPEQSAALDALRAATPRTVVTTARPAPGSPNVTLPAADVAAAELPPVGKVTSARAGVEAAYALIAKSVPDNMFVVSCDLDPSTKLGKARTFLAADHQFELSIEEQVAAIVTNGLATATIDRPQVNVVSTFAAFFEGIAREGCEMWRYQRNLNGVNEGLNVIFHMSHVGAITGRDHFSGWSLDWITLGLGYLPYLDRFYTPADARGAFVAIRDAAERYGAHIVAIPRDNVPVLGAADGSAIYDPESAWEPVSTLSTVAGAKTAILALGATAFIAEEAAKTLNAAGTATDVYVINGFPIEEADLQALLGKYDGIVTVEDGLIATRAQGLRGFAGLVAGAAYGSSLKLEHVGIADPRVAPADGHMEVWEHFGITADAIVASAQQVQ